MAPGPGGAGPAGGDDPSGAGQPIWKAILPRVLDGIRANQMPLLAAGVAFYAMLALVPAMVAVVSIYGLVVSPAQAARDVATLTRALPPDARHLISGQLQTIARDSATHLGLGTGLGLALALWSASSAMRWIMTALSLVYDETETRPYLRLRAEAVLLTGGAVVSLGVALGGLFGVPAVLRHLGLSEAARAVADVARFPILGGFAMLSLAVLYRFGPDRRQPAWRWLSHGSALAAALWVAGSLGLTLYADNVSKFSAAGTYGALGAVVILMLWLWLTAFAILLGGEVNAEVEHQIAPAGWARAADRVASGAAGVT